MKFNTKLSDILDILKQEKSKNICIAGDFNLDLLKEQTHAPTSEFLSNFISYSFAPVVQVPTRITDTTSTAIDNIFINCSEYLYKSAVVISDISDHLPIALCLPTKLHTAPNSMQFSTRNFSQNNIHTFNAALENIT